MLPSSAMTCSRDTASVFPTMSLMRVGRYFSTCTQAGPGVGGAVSGSGERRRGPPPPPPARTDEAAPPLSRARRAPTAARTTRRAWTWRACPRRRPPPSPQPSATDLGVPHAPSSLLRGAGGGPAPDRPRFKRLGPRQRVRARSPGAGFACVRACKGEVERHRKAAGGAEVWNESGRHAQAPNLAPADLPLPPTRPPRLLAGWRCCCGPARASGVQDVLGGSAQRPPRGAAGAAAAAAAW